MASKTTKVLVVEDEPGMAFLLNRLLEKLGYSVLATVDSGEEAVELVSKTKPDIILMDIYLAGKMNGIQAAELILAKEHIPVIYATSDTDEQTLQNAKSTYPLGYIVKPYDKNVLKSTIEVALSIKEVEHRKNEELRMAYDTITYQTGELMESFKSAKEIQKAILPSESDFQRIFPNSFVLNRPKESLGGDFFWYKKLSSEEYIFGVIDCTGHGVPGALMSILVNYQLSKGLGELPKGSHISDLYNFIDKNLSDVYWEDDFAGFSEGDDSGIKNLNAGFDSGLCYINTTTHLLSYSGAKRPLWVFRNNEIIEIQGSRASVGLYSHDGKAFKDDNIQILNGDRLFLFSDGFTDQIGGSNQKRYLTRNFKSLILRTGHLPPAEQRIALIQEFQQWKGLTEQMDDVLVLGIEF